MSKKINVKDYAKEILSALPHGVLLNTASNGRTNTMTIGWGALGTDFGKDVFTIYVRKSRFTKQLLDESGEFTISIPVGEAVAEQKDAVAYCGTQSGNKVEDKIKDAGLTAIKGEMVKSPSIKEFPLTLECKVVFSTEKKIPLIDNNYQKFYPMGDTKYKIGKIQDPHYIYEGEIVNAYIID